MLDEGNIEDIQSETKRIIELAGDDPDVCYQTAKILCDHNDFLDAVPLFDLAVSLYNPPPKEMLDKLFMAIYFGFSEPNAPDILPDLTWKIPPEWEDLLQARYMLYVGDKTEAKELIAQILANPPDLPAENLLEAEMYIQEQDFDAAKTVLMDLQTEENLPLWIQKHIEDLYQQIES
jgi:tetratricopeptide (TPR) repeat protein